MGDRMAVQVPESFQREGSSASAPVRRKSGADHLERLASSFEVSARRWELIVYPSLFAFIILAAYGFYLIYSLANDVSYMSRSVDRNMSALVQHFETVSEDMDQLTVSVGRMSNNMRNISGQIEVLDDMTDDMSKMQRSVSSMSSSTHYIRGDMATLNNSIARPLSFVSKFMPW